MEQRVIPCAEGFGVVVQNAIGAFLGHIDEYYAAAFGKSCEGLRYHLVEWRYIARSAVEKNSIIFIGSEVGVFGFGDSDIHSSFSRYVGHPFRGLNAVADVDAAFVA